ncbi:MAG TPA: hypothetical protein VFN73_14020 [Propionibacteriaceae bacterium]|nr:hypothetical protein [Propionibacteriaceae bacterium]
MARRTRPGPRDRRLPPDESASSIAPRAMLAGFVTTLVATTVGAGAEAGYLEATDPTRVSAATNAVDLLRTAGIGALAGLVAGVVIMVLTAWLAMMLRPHLQRGRRRARLLGLLLSTVLWALGVWLGLGVLGFSGLGSTGYLLASPALVVAWVLTWFFAPWVAAPRRRD